MFLTVSATSPASAGRARARGCWREAGRLSQNERCARRGPDIAAGERRDHFGHPLRGGEPSSSVATLTAHAVPICRRQHHLAFLAPAFARRKAPEQPGRHPTRSGPVRIFWSAPSRSTLQKRTPDPGDAADVHSERRRTSSRSICRHGPLALFRLVSFGHVPISSISIPAYSRTAPRRSARTHYLTSAISVSDAVIHVEPPGDLVLHGLRRRRQTVRVQCARGATSRTTVTRDRKVTGRRGAEQRDDSPLASRALPARASPHACPAAGRRRPGM